MKDAISCTLRCVYPPHDGRVTLAFNEVGTDQVYRLSISEYQAAVLSEMLKNTALSNTAIQSSPVSHHACAVCLQQLFSVRLLLKLADEARDVATTASKLMMKGVLAKIILPKYC